MTAEEFVAQATGSTRPLKHELVQEAWSGYGSIVRYALSYADGGEGPSSVVLKHITPPATPTHARGWATDYAVERKIRSYAVELAFYRSYAPQLKRCRVPALLAHKEAPGNESLLLLEDLSAAGFPRRVGPSTSGHKSRRLGEVSLDELRSCILWLARFHASFLSNSGNAFPGLWETGTYWNLATRPDEFEAMPQESQLCLAAKKIDEKLAKCEWQTVLHGDAKIANFCFGPVEVVDETNQVAAIDFQYCGRGCGVKDLAYLLGSGLLEDDLIEHSASLMDLYFAELRDSSKADLEPSEWAEIESEWRILYPWAVADFERFVYGWAPNHWKRNAYTLAQTAQVIKACQIE